MDCSYDPTACQIDSRAGSVGLSRPRHSYEYDMTTVVYAQAVWSVIDKGIHIDTHRTQSAGYPSLSSYPFLSAPFPTTITSFPHPSRHSREGGNLAVDV